ncbi:hypothetical protein [Tsukamurella pseudospumae]|uniref:Uncharacterized protein n=1 Tax=Tsukamurella pseudospumae TaxID=239498 RepID=A0A137ZZ92_9ACTN|nr:hypothetical protein [Tsukamurella pseudospumae]KXO98023.1 hypothetical protein AXK61_20900 [Tsukamurella pseudospumae]KXP03495.1 hypothetical protein AXK60_16890 [Tsukamurella pseudospumae]
MLVDALDHHRDVYEILFAADDIDTARTTLMAKYGWSEHGTNAVLDMQQRRLPKAERERITVALRDLTAEIARVEAEQHNRREL